ncbi:hypothetical protein DRQ25_08260 [Candidatus Fermentibacteria bacterium]|nr:MAG: hypothetical protein DRQ25_08260 [Candidatus Fermentibacteria bacterium]
MRYGTVLFFILILISCAKMAPPGGGPVDETPPEILSIFPTPGPGCTDLRTISVEWTERLDEASVAVFIYPTVEYKLHVNGSRIEIELLTVPEQELLVIHLPKEIRDRRGNQVGISNDLVYSSADSLPTGELGVSMVRQGGGSLSSITLVELYRDSVLVRRTVPDTSGTAWMKWLDPGDYSLLCYEDPDRSFQWNSQQEAGIDTSITLMENDSMRVNFTLTVVDTAGPILTDVTAIDSYHLQLLFNEEVSCESFSRGEVVLQDSLGDEIPVNGFWLPGGYSGTTVMLDTWKIPDALNTAYVKGIEDLMFNSSPSDSLEFFGIDSIPADSLRIRSYYPAPGSDNTDPAGPYMISFNYWIDTDSLAARFRLRSVADSMLVPGALTAVDGRSFEFYPDHQLIGEQQYRLELLPGLSTLWGDTLRMPFGWVFSPYWGDEPGSISGRIRGSVSPSLTLQISRTGGGGDAAVTYAAVRLGDYQVSGIPAGRYTVAAFVDRDASGTWGPMEPYGTFPGVVLVQPGLITGEVDIDILP